jgi:hypothetical protein
VSWFTNRWTIGAAVRRAGPYAASRSSAWAAIARVRRVAARTSTTTSSVRVSSASARSVATVMRFTNNSTAPSTRMIRTGTVATAAADSTA